MAYDGSQQKKIPARERLNHEQRILLSALMGGAPGVVTSLIILWELSYTLKVQWTLTLLILGCWLGFAFSLRTRIVRHFQTLSNLLAALREGDYSIRARGARREDALGDVMSEVNALGETLRAQRLGAMEATALLRNFYVSLRRAMRRSSRKLFPARRGAGACGAARFASAACPISCSCSQTSAANCAKKNAKPGSDSCACSAMN
jgi:methyl-accepting chemotaxis protein